MEKVTAVILNYNSSSDCEKCILFLKKQNYDDLGIIVVDNASNDDELGSIKKIAKANDVELICNEANKGFAAGNNVGLRTAVEGGAKWCLVINPDVELRDENYVSKMIAKINEHEEVAMAASSIVLPDGTLQNPQKESTFGEDVFWMGQYIKKNNDNSNWNVEQQKTGYCEKVSGCCFFVSADFLKDINYLDENTFLYCEEAILAKQVESAGKNILYVHDVKADHVHEAEKNSYEKVKRFVESRNYYVKKYSGYNKLQVGAVLVANKMEKVLFRFKKY